MSDYSDYDGEDDNLDIDNEGERKDGEDDLEVNKIARIYYHQILRF